MISGNLFKISKTRLRRLLILASVGIVVFTFYYFVDPFSAKWLPKCLFKQLTGFDCPGCGSQRFLHALIHGDLQRAAEANLFLLFFTPYMLFWGWVETDPGLTPRLHRAMNSVPAIIILLTLILAWTILRN